MSDLKDAIEGLGPVVAQAGANSTAGRVLREAREAKKLSLDDVAQYLKYSPRQLDALERDDYSNLPGPTVVRGIIRSYAKLLDLDPEPLIGSARDRLSPTPTAMTADAMNVSFPAKNAAGHRAYWILSGLAAAGAVIFLVDWSGVASGIRSTAERFGIGGGADAGQTSTTEAAPAPVAAKEPVTSGSSPVELVTSALPTPDSSAPAAATPSAAPSATTASPAAPAAAAPAAPTAAAPATTAAAPAPAAPTSATPPAGQKRVVMQFTQDSWVEIRHADGRVLFSQINPAGSERTIDVAPPVRLVIGAANGVKLTYNGKPVDLARHTVVDVARLGLD